MPRRQREEESTDSSEPTATGQPFVGAHYGDVNEELLGYFKNVETTIDENAFHEAEDRRLFVDNVYSEVEGNEIRLGTNYSCSLILEKLLRMSNAFQLRVFTDKLSGKSIELFVHRFASHVCQTLLTLAADIVEQEVLEGGAKVPEGAGDEDVGELLSMEQLVLGICEDIEPVIKDLIKQQFASHVIRVLLFVLAGKRIDESGATGGHLRSKKSAKYKKENDNVSKISGKASSNRRVPDSFKAKFRSFTKAIAGASEEEIRSLAVDRVASPVIQLLLEMQEKDKKGKAAVNLLLDRILPGIASKGSGMETNEARDVWFETLMRDQVGSHLLEMIFKVAPDAVYNTIYVTYLRNKLLSFSLQPISNYVIQNMLSNCRSASQLDMMVEELGGSFGKLLQSRNYGVIRHLMDAVAKLKSSEKAAVDALAKSLQMEDVKNRDEWVNCVIRLWTLETWKNASDRDKNFLKNFHIQGSLILQAMAKMSSEYSSTVAKSFQAQSVDVIYQWCTNPVGSRAFESVLTSPTISPKHKNRLMRSLLGCYADLAKDKFGSHIIDHCWEIASIGLKEKIVQELLQRERELSEHYIGRCILWTCKIDQYKRKHDDWVEREKGVERKKEMFKDILE